MKRTLFTGLFFLLTWFVTATPLSSADSLNMLLKKAQGKQKVLLLIRISEKNRGSSSFASKQYFQQAVALARKLKNDSLTGLAYKSIGVSYFYWGEMKKSKEAFSTGLHYFKKAKNKKGIADCLNDLGLIYENWGNYDSAFYYYKASYLMEKKRHNPWGEALSLINMGNIDYYRKDDYNALKNYSLALQDFIDLNSPKGIAMAYNSLAVIYTDIGEYNRALDYLEKARKSYSGTNDKVNIARVLNNMADIYSEHLKEYKKAETLYQEALQLKQELNDKEGVALVKCNLGVLYSNMGALTQALRYFAESEKIYLGTGNQWGLSMVYLNKGKVFLDAGKYRRAAQEFQKSLAISSQKGLKDFTIKNYQGLFKSYAGLGDYKNFNRYYALYKKNQDSLTKKLKEFKISNLEANFKIDSLTKQKNDLLRESMRTKQKIKNVYLFVYALLLSLVIIILALLLYRRARKEKKSYMDI